MAIVANDLLGCKNFIGLHSVAIFVKYHKVSTCMILPNFVGHCRDSVVFAFLRRCRQMREKEEAYVR